MRSSSDTFTRIGSPALCAEFCATALVFLACTWGLARPAHAQAGKADTAYGKLKFRQVGPFRGGRSVAVAGVQTNPLVFYMGGTGGGVFKTVDAGNHWLPVSDGQLQTGSVGAIAVADSDPNVIYVGMGEGDIRGNASHGDGVYKSTDAGHTWKNVGLAETQQIGAVRIDPKNPDLVYVAALGHMAGPNPERGVFRSRDGGKTWQKVLYKSDRAGAIDVAIDPLNSRILYASLWQVIRKPWTFESGGPDSGLYKSTDGGDTWQEITRNHGLPAGVIGRIGIAVSPVKAGRVWAIVEAAEGGIFRSEDGGATWTKVNAKREIRQRAWYYSRIFADPVNPDTMYALNTAFYRSRDGGVSFQTIPTDHGDNHDLWIAANDPNRMIESNDGGANISLDGGKSWSTEDNQPTAQFYRVALDNDFPYHLYGAQQDNSTVEIASRGNDGAITERDWHDVGGGESGWIAPDPGNSNIVYAGSYDGLLTRYDHRTGALRNVTVWPDNPMGSGVEAMKYRFQWSYPLVFSHFDPKLLYAGSNVLLATTDEGQHWKAISPDLTRDDKSKQGPVGGPITKDNTAVEYYDTIFTIDESPIAKGLIWVGSDDGLIHLTRDGGKTWTNVTPKDFPDWIRVNCIAASPQDPAVAYVAATMYLSDDFRPFLYKTSDYGKTWKKIVNGIPNNDFTRAIRPDPRRKGLLIAGTETNLYISYNDGERWMPFQLNLPHVPVTDVAFQKREDNLVVATQGRGFYILDDMALVRALDPSSFSPQGVHLFAPKAAYRYSGGGGGGEEEESNAGQNPATGVVINYFLKDKPKSDVVLRIEDSSGKLIREFSSKPAAKPASDAPAANGGEHRPKHPLPTANAGMNSFVWDMRYPDATTFPGIILWDGSVRGPVAVPGQYKVTLVVDGQTQSEAFTILKDPRAPTTPDDFQKQLALALQVQKKLSQSNQAVLDIQNATKQLAAYSNSPNVRVRQKATQIASSLREVEEAIYQTKLRADEDALNFPIRLNNKFASLLSTINSTDVAPTEQSYQVYQELSARLQVQLEKLKKITEQDIADFNKLVREENIPAVAIESKS